MFADDLFVPHKRKLKLNKPCELKHLSSKRKKKITQDFESSGERTRNRLCGRNEREVAIFLRCMGDGPYTQTLPRVTKDCSNIHFKDCLLSFAVYTTVLPQLSKIKIRETMI